MKKIIDFIKKKTIFCYLLLIIVIFIPSAISIQPQSFNKLIVKAFAIDRVEGQFEFTALAYIPKAAQTFSENYQIIRGKGESLNSAIMHVSRITGKTMALAEANLVLVNDELCEFGLLKGFDYLVREYSLANNTLILSSGHSLAGDVLEFARDISNDIGISLYDMSEYIKKYVLSSNICLETLYSESFSPSKSLLIPVILLTEKEGLELSSESSNSDDNILGQGNSSSGESSSQSSSSLDEKLLNDGRAIVLEEGKKLLDLTYEEVFSLGWAKNSKDYGLVELKNYSDNIFTNATLSFYVFENKARIKTKFEGNKPVCEISICPKIMLDEVSQEDFNQDFYSQTYHLKTSNVAPAVSDKVSREFLTVFKRLISHNVDILSVYENFYANHTAKFKKFLNSLEDESIYISKIEFRINVNVNILE